MNKNNIVNKIMYFIIMLLIAIIMLGKVYAISECNVEIKAQKNNLNKNDEFTVDVNISNIKSEMGITAFGATLEYDKESLNIEKIEGRNEWETPTNGLTFNEENGKIAITKSGFAKKNETIFKITFKVKEQSAKNPTITLKNITASGGIATGDIPVADMTKTITVKTPVTPANNTVNTNTNTNTNTNPGTVIKPTNNTNTNTNTNAGATNENKAPTNPSTNSTIVATTSNSSTQPDSVKTGILPKTGATRVLLVVLGITAVVSVVFYIKMKKLDINMK